MTTNTIDEALKQASGNNKTEVKSNQNQQESPSIIDNRGEISSEAYLDGMWASNDYIQGFTQGFTDGVLIGRKRIMRQLCSEFRASRSVPLTVDLSSVCDNFPVIESKPIFQLPKAS